MKSGDFLTVRFVSPQRGEFKGRTVAAVSFNGHEIKTIDVLPDANWYAVLNTVAAVMMLTGELEKDYSHSKKET